MNAVWGMTAVVIAVCFGFALFLIRKVKKNKAEQEEKKA